jgi:hypothetical protein
MHPVLVYGSTTIVAWQVRPHCIVVEFVHLFRLGLLAAVPGPRIPYKVGTSRCHGKSVWDKVGSNKRDRYAAML